MMLKDLADYLQAKGYGTKGTDLFYGHQPDSPPACITLFEFGGDGPDQVLNLETPGLQVNVRDPDYAAGRETAGAILEELHTLWETGINGTRYLYIKATGTPIPLGRNKAGQFEFTVNFTVVKER